MKKKKNKKDKRVYMIMMIGIMTGIIISITSSYVLAQTLVNSKDVYYEDNSSLAVNNVQAAIDGTCTKFSTQLQEFLLKVYPVGSIYISYNSTNPSSLFGGTWENYGNGRVLKGINSGTAGTTGGSDTVTLKEANLPAHTHTYDKVNANTGSHTLTIAEMPSHTHEQQEHWHFILSDLRGGYFGLLYGSNDGNKGTAITSGVDQSGFGYSTRTDKVKAINQNTGGDGGHTHPISTTSTNTGSTGSGTSFSVQNSYITVYMWRRTK